MKGLFYAVCTLLLLYGGYQFSRFVRQAHSEEASVSSPLLESIRDLSQYVTASYYADTLVNLKWTGLLKDDQLIRSYEMSVEAGFDFTDLELERLVVRDDTAVYLYLPEPRVLSCICNPSNKVAYVAKGVSDEKMQEIDVKVKQSIQQQAEQRGLLQKARQNGIEELTQFFVMLGFERQHVHVMPRLEISKE